MSDEASRAETRDDQSPRIRIFQATMAVALRLGFGKITIETVAREAGFRKGGLLYHFKTKNHLIEAMLEHYASPTCRGSEVTAIGGIDPFILALLIAAADNPALLEPYREEIGGASAQRSLVAVLVERFCRAEQAHGQRVEKQAFAVRKRGAEQLFGLFVAQGQDALWDMVDEFCDPAEHEYQLVENGALIASEGTDAAISGSLIDIVTGQGEWTPFDASDEGSGLIARIVETTIGLKASPRKGEE